jgi:transposase
MHLKPEWVQRYARRFDGYHLPTGKAKREELAVKIGEDGFYLLQAIYSETGPQELKESPKVDILRRIWVQQFYWTDGKVYWRTKDKWGQPPAGKMIGSPDDLKPATVSNAVPNGAVIKFISPKPARQNIRA